MTRSNPSPGRQPALPLAELFQQYLRRQAAAQADGGGFAEPTDEVLPYEAVPVQPVDPKLAWDDGRAVLKLFPAALRGLAAKAPPEWPQLVASQEPATALALCLGNFPQLVRNLQPLLAGGP